MKPSHILFLLLTLAVLSCSKNDNINIAEETFGVLPSGEHVMLYTMKNANGMQASVMNYGATLVSLKTADNMGQISEITLGFDSLKQYLEKSPYFGATVGRYANRIADGKFTLDGQEYHLATNNGPNHLHGGVRGFDKVFWDAETSQTEESKTVTFRYTSVDGEEGYPGTVNVTVAYTLTDGNTLKIEYAATTDKPTIINLSNHTYFNLKDAGKTDILGHVIKINTDAYTPVDETLIPTGEIVSVHNTPFDFQQPRAIGERIHDDHPQIAIAGGYDHNFVLGTKVIGMRLAATVFEPTTGRVMNIATSEPGLQFYSGNFLNGLKGRNNAVYNKHAAFCMEPQHFPDSPNKPQFPTVVLRPGKEFTSLTIYKFFLKFVGLEEK